MFQKWLTELWRRDAVLAWAGLLQLALFIVMLGIAPFDSRLVTGLNPWIKPMKFALSFVMYLWTLTWFMKYIVQRHWARQVVRWGISGAILIEMICIAGQAARGATSHYNVSTPFNFAVFVTMSVAIFVNTVFVILLLGLFCVRIQARASAYQWGICLGLFLFVLGNLEGLAMIFRSAHSVGIADGGPGLPFVNWSTRAGDLRVAHALGMHALQVVPLIGYGISRWLSRTSIWRQVICTMAFAAIWASLGLLSFVQAKAGRVSFYPSIRPAAEAGLEPRRVMQSNRL